MSSQTTFEDIERELKESADGFAKLMSADGTRFHFDFSVGSINELENFLDSVAVTRSFNEEEFQSISYDAATYIGEVIRRNNLGKWIKSDEEPNLKFESPLIVRTKFAVFEPWNWTYKRVINGAEDNITFKFEYMVLKGLENHDRSFTEENFKKENTQKKKGFFEKLFE